MTIKIEIPSGNEHKTLAAAIGAALVSYGTGETFSAELTTTSTVVEHDLGDELETTVDEQHAQLAADGASDNTPVEETVEEETQLDGVDKNGLPHDQRIHSKPPTINADGSWKARRKPKEMDKQQWLDYIAVVEGELKQALSGEPIVEDVPPPVVEEETTEEIVPPPVAEDTPPPTIEEPTGELPDVTFADLMKLITSNGAKMNQVLGDGQWIPHVTEVVKANGVDSLPLVNTVSQQRPELIPTIYVQLESVINAS